MPLFNHENKNIVKGALVLTISGIIVKLLGLIYKIPLSYILSDEGMGYFNSAYTIYVFFYIICTAGVPKAISILISEENTENNSEKVQYIYMVAIRLFIIIGISATLIFLLFSRTISVLIGNRGSYYTMLAVAPSVMFVCAGGVLRGYFNGRVNFVPIAVSELIAGVSKLVLGLIFAFFTVKFTDDLCVVSAMTILGVSVGSFFSFLYLAMTKKILFREYKDINHVNNRNNIIRRIFKLSLPLTLTSVIGAVCNIIDLSLIMRRLESIGYTDFQAGVLYGNYTTLVIPLTNAAITIISPLFAVILPYVTREHSRGNLKNIMNKTEFSFGIINILVVFICFVFLIKPYGVLLILFEDSSAKIAAPLLYISACGILFMSLLTAVHTILEAKGNTLFPLISLTLGTVIKFILCYILIGYEDLGILGAPISSVISYLFSFVLSLSYVFFFAKIKLKVLSCFFPATLSCIVAYLFTNVLTRRIDTNTALGNIIYFFCLGVIYLAAVGVCIFIRKNVNLYKTEKIN